ncbi:MAG: 2-hydroxyacid dehydrogenase [Rhodobacteraceae bacterium]|nr:2-hydroxyacid dehydrogenase [Paracoccaceae bacterium]
MKPDVLVLYPTRPKAMAALDAAYVLHRYDEAADKAAFLAEVGGRCRAIVTNGHAKLTRDMVDQLPELRLVACASAGYESIDVAALSERGIKLTTTSNALFDDVADTAVMLMLAARRDLVRAHAYVASGDWGRKGMYPLQSSISGKSVGIVGMGTIGKAIARRCAPMNVSIAYYARSDKGVPWRFEPDLERLARESDILIVVVPGGPETRNLIDARILAALGPRGTLINVARGSVVDETALIDALGSGALGSAGLDVFWNEPNPDPALTGLPNVILYPHHASGTEETRDAMAQLVVDNLAAFYADRPLLTPVN